MHSGRQGIAGRTASGPGLPHPIRPLPIRIRGANRTNAGEARPLLPACFSRPVTARRGAVCEDSGPEGGTKS